MTEEEANIRLNNNHNLYFTNTDSKITRYAAVIKKSNDFTIKNDYVIEIAYNSGEIEYDPIKKSNFESSTRILDLLNLPKVLRDEIQEGILEINKTPAPDITYQNRTDDLTSIYKTSLKRHPKLTGGISVFDQGSGSGSGTAGAFFKITSDNDVYLLSNYHVLLYQNGKIGDIIVHPSKSDSVQVANSESKEIGNIFWKKDIQNNSFNLIDAAVAKIKKDDDVIIDTGRYTRCLHIEMLGLAEPKIGMNVKKCGKTTGLTYGEIRSTNCTVNISNDNKLEIYKNQILTTNMSSPGDSGSVLVNQDNMVVGLLFGGDNFSLSVANNINIVFELIKKDLPNFNFYKFI